MLSHCRCVSLFTLKLQQKTTKTLGFSFRVMSQPFIYTRYCVLGILLLLSPFLFARPPSWCPLPVSQTCKVGNMTFTFRITLSVFTATSTTYISFSVCLSCKAQKDISFSGTFTCSIFFTSYGMLEIISGKLFHIRNSRIKSQPDEKVETLILFYAIHAI